MFVPSQGLRHAATLLLTNAARAIPAGSPPDATRMRLEHLAEELVALADDARAPAASADWLLAEFNATIDRLHQSFDREHVKSAGAAIIGRISSRTRIPAARDLFLIYVPEDRLPIAAPLAVELTKRRISVALAEYEVATDREFEAALEHGLANHRAGIVLWTSAFDRRRWPLPGESNRIRIARSADGQSTLAEALEWWERLQV